MYDGCDVMVTFEQVIREGELKLVCRITVNNYDIEVDSVFIEQSNKYHIGWAERLADGFRERGIPVAPYEGE